LVSSDAVRIESVRWSAYITTSAVDVAGRTTDRLDERGLRAQEPLLVGVQDGHQRHLGQVQPLAQQVDADQGVELAEAQLAQDLDPLDRVDLGVQVAHLHAGSSR
jgi:hypothetical protein